MIPKEILKKVRKIEIIARDAVNNVFSGEYKSVFKGQGMEFNEVREYQPGDDIRNIDWNVTARMGHPYIKKFMEERETSTSLQKKRTRTRYTRKVLTPKRLAEPTHISSMTMAGILLLIIVASFAGYCIYTSWNPFSFLMKETNEIQTAIKGVFSDEKPVQDVQVTEEIVIIPVETASQETITPPSDRDEEADIDSTASVADKAAEASPEEESPAALPDYNVFVQFLKDTQLELQDDTAETMTLDFKAGESQSWTTSSSLTLTFMQPDSAEILVNDNPVPFPADTDGNYTLEIPQDIPHPSPDE